MLNCKKASARAWQKFLPWARSQRPFPSCRRSCGPGNAPAAPTKLPFLSSRPKSTPQVSTPMPSSLTPILATFTSACFISKNSRGTSQTKRPFKIHRVVGKAVHFGERQLSIRQFAQHRAPAGRAKIVSQYMYGSLHRKFPPLASSNGFLFCGIVLPENAPFRDAQSRIPADGNKYFISIAIYAYTIQPESPRLSTMSHRVIHSFRAENAAIHRLIHKLWTNCVVEFTALSTTGNANLWIFYQTAVDSTSHLVVFILLLTF